MNIKEYGYTGTREGCVARITAVHRDRFGIAGDFGEGYARLKAGEYYAGDEIFPTAGDFVLIDHIENGDSRILATLPRKTVFTRREPGCAIRAAIAAGELDIERWESYRKLKAEAVDKDELLRRKREWSKGVAKFTKQRKKEIW